MLVVDGDTLVVDGQPVRLLGVQAPVAERDCPAEAGKRSCAASAEQALTRLVAGARVRCDGLEGPRFGKEVVATCWADERDIGRALVEAGWALADRRYSSRYVHVEAEARRAGRGFWAGPGRAVPD